jgi:sulfatase maturation enzyme AslB (radical SAM superfamily)
MRITNDGNFEYCRWSSQAQINHSSDAESVNNTDIVNWFSKSSMSDIRRQMLQGQPVAGCSGCYNMERHGKVSGRQRQLLKTGIDTLNFNKTLASSPWLSSFKSSLEHGHTETAVVDWQVDLGNHCNSACVFCAPEFSSRLAQEYQSLGLIADLPDANWTQDKKNLDKFLDALAQSPGTRYLHFIGGETILTPAFKTILQHLLDSGFNKSLTLGFTTNLTVWRDDIVELLKNFSVNLGLSVEALHPVNDYIRWGSSLDAVISLKNRWLELARQESWTVSYRTTPTMLSIGQLLTVYDDAWQQGLGVESCNFLERPEFLRPVVLGQEYLEPIVDHMKSWISEHSHGHGQQLINTRDLNRHRVGLVQDLESYVSYLSSSESEISRLPEAMTFLKKLESRRRNSIISYLPEYEKLFRSAGY